MITNFISNRNHAKGSKSDLYRQVMLKHLEFQQKYIGTSKPTPPFIPLSEIRINSFFSVTNPTDEEQYEISMMSSIDGYKALLKEKTASVVANFQPTFAMNDNYLDCLDKFIEMQLVSSTITYSSLIKTYFTPSHTDIDSFAFCLSSTLLTFDPSLDLNNKSKLEQQAKKHAHILNSILEHPYSPMVIDQICDYVIEIDIKKPNMECIKDYVKNQYCKDHIVVLVAFDLNVSNEKMRSFLTELNDSFIETHDPDRHLLASTIKLIQAQGLNPENLNSADYKNFVHESINSHLINHELACKNDLINYSSQVASCGVIGILTQVISYQFVQTPSKDEALAVMEYVNATTPISDTKKWSTFLNNYLKATDLKFDLHTAKKEDLMGILISMANNIEVFSVNGSHFALSILSGIADNYIKDKIENTFHFEVGNYS